jgi:hypothetical protein
VSAGVIAVREDTPLVPLSRIAWLVTVGACVIAALVLVLSGYDGYAGVALAIAISAGITLR